MGDILTIDNTGSIDLYTEFDQYSDSYNSYPDHESLLDNNSQTIQETEDNFSVEDQNVFNADQVDEATDNSEPLIVNNTDYIDNNDDVVEELKKINESISRVNGNDIGDSVSDNIISVVSSNEIMTKSIQDYTVSESLTLMIFLTMFCVGLVFIIRKGIYKWT